MNLEIRQIFEKFSDTKFHENPSNVSRVEGKRERERQTDRHDEANSRFSQFCECAWQDAFQCWPPLTSLHKIQKHMSILLDRTYIYPRTCKWLSSSQRLLCSFTYAGVKWTFFRGETKLCHLFSKKFAQALFLWNHFSLQLPRAVLPPTISGGQVWFWLSRQIT